MLPTSSLDAPYPSVPAPESSQPGPPPPVGTPALLPEFRRGSRSNPRRRSRREGGKKQRQRRRLALLRSRPVLPVGRRVMALSPAPYRLPTSFPVTPSISLPPYLSPTSSRGIPWAMLQALDISPASSLDTPPAISPAPDFSPPAPDFSPAPDYLPPPPPPSPPLDFSPPPPSPQAQSATPVAASHSPESSLNTSSRPTDSDFSSRSSPSSTTGIVGSVVGGVVALVILSIVFICLRRRMKRHTGTSEGQQKNWLQSVLSPAQHVIKILPAVYASRPADSPPGPPPIPVTAGGRGSSGPEDPVLFSPSPGAASLGFSKNTFTYEELVVATDGFTDANLLGQGGFGYVHRGTLPNGKEVAVKQLKAGSGQGEREFQAEVEIISRVHHKHLVSLAGYCITGEKRLLVYEFVPNNTLEFHLHGKGQPVLEWSTRMKIALGSAKGLAYLHEDCHPKIIHRDIKASNILLDAKFEAKVADFGLAKITAEVDTHVSTRVMGTFGYLAPEYAASGKLTDRSDVFSFGVMLLELITGRQPADPTNAFMEEYLVDWARPLLTRALEDGNYEALVDPRLQKNYDVSEMTRLVACAAACVRHVGWRRPGMNQIVRFLQGDVSQEDLNEGVTPSRSPAYGSSTEHERKQYNEDMRKFIKLALGSQDYPTSEYSAPTSQHGLTQSGSSSEVKSTSRETESGSTKKDSRSFSGGS